jgi:phosphopantothenoylcysteine decarboxylase/phosphopantothenate--cysteine ligase
MDSLDGKNVILGVTGSISAYKAADIARRLKGAGARVQVAMTRSACAFVTPLTFEALTGRPVMTDALEVRDGTIPHVDQAYAAELAIIAPATADSLAKMAHGIADEALYATLLSFRGPLVIAPAMETRMWSHPATEANCAVLRGRGAIFVGPEAGELASGRAGQGRLSEPGTIVAVARSVVGGAAPARSPEWEETSADIPVVDKVGKWPTHKTGTPLVGRRILITAGPTVEDVDPVRFLTNRSSGKMGVALAKQARARGASVHLVHGPMQIDPPDGVRTHAVRSAEEMNDEVRRLVDAGMDAAILAAAVADYRPLEQAPEKVKKVEGELTLQLVRNPDILAGLGTLEARPILIGFAAETESIEANARAKLEKKNCDLICANSVRTEDGAFGNDSNEVTLFFRDGRKKELGRAPKEAIADGILDALADLLPKAATA